MNRAEYKELRITSWRRALTPVEEAQLQAYLAAHPEDKPDSEEDAALSQFLLDLSDAPVSSNFTSQVMQALDREASDRGQAGRSNWWRRWTPRMGWAVLVIGIATLAVQLKEKAALDQAALEEGVDALVKTLPPAPQVVLTDFDVIREMPVVELDEELWLALSQ